MGAELSSAGAQSSAVRSLSQVNLAHEAYGELKRGLMSGGFRPGVRLTIRELATAMGISPTPVREALVQLAAEGALSQTAGRSLIVPKLDADSYQDLRHLRELIEGDGAAMAAQRIGSKDIDQLALIHDGLVTAMASSDYRQLLDWNHRFHLKLCEASGSRRLQKIVEGLWLQMGPLLNVLYENKNVPQHNSRHGHLDVIDALRARDSEAARRAIQIDIAGSAETILANLKGHQATAGGRG
jgi:GntR family transcriptional regulator, colanic acid and biofilm gene transcriptional regulator